MSTLRCACAITSLCLASAATAAGPSPTNKLVINEIDVDTPGVDTLEFIELYDGGSGNTDLNGYVVVLYNGADDASYAAIDLDGFTTDAGGFFLIGGAAVPGVHLVISTGQLQNGPDAIAVHIGDASDFPGDTPVTSAGLVDSIVYGTNDPPDRELLDALGGEQADESALGDPTSASIARMPDGAGPFTTVDAPTPGDLNQGVPVCPADVSGNGLVGVEDLVIVILAWGTSDPQADADGSGLVDEGDLVTVIVGWGVCG